MKTYTYPPTISLGASRRRAWYSGHRATPSRPAPPHRIWQGHSEPDNSRRLCYPGLVSDARATLTRRLRKYGLTLAQYDAVLAAQFGCCAICERPFAESVRVACVDHDHRTRTVRGLLCVYCNRWVLGRLGAAQAAAVLDYLTSPPAARAGVSVAAPKKRRRR